MHSSGCFLKPFAPYVSHQHVSRSLPCPPMSATRRQILDNGLRLQELVTACKAASTAAGPASSQDEVGAYSDLSGALTLENIRQQLILMEDTIIFSLIERAQFARNMPVYQPDAIPVPGFGRDGRRLSLLDYLLRETEQVHGKIRRYTSPEENAYFPDDQPPLVLPPITYPPVSACSFLCLAMRRWHRTRWQMQAWFLGPVINPCMLTCHCSHCSA
jgi:hypothetical protein